MSNRTTNNRSHGVTLFAVDDRTTAFFVAAVRLRCERFVAAVTDGTHATPLPGGRCPLPGPHFHRLEPVSFLAHPSTSCDARAKKTEQRNRGRRGQAAPRRWGQGRRKAGVKLAMTGVG